MGTHASIQDHPHSISTHVTRFLFCIHTFIHTMQVFFSNFNQCTPLLNLPTAWYSTTVFDHPFTVSSPLDTYKASQGPSIWQSIDHKFHHYSCSFRSLRGLRGQVLLSDQPHGIFFSLLSGFDVSLDLEEPPDFARVLLLSPWIFLPWFVYFICVCMYVCVHVCVRVCLYNFLGSF